MRKLVTIQKVAEVRPIDGADKVESIRVNDWWLVSGKGNFEVGAICLFFEIDSLLPRDDERFAFLANGSSVKTVIVDGVTYSGSRLRTKKIRGVLSQGLAMPIADFTEITSLTEGDDVTSILGVVKWEAPLAANLAGNAKGNFPDFLHKTDEERVQNCGKVVAKHAGGKFYVAEKLDGSSATYYKKDGVFGVCSRNLDLLKTEGNTFWKIAENEAIEAKLPEGYAVQGEIVGEGIQMNPLKLTGQHLYVFNVFDINKDAFFSYDQMENFCRINGFVTVPILDTIDLPGEVAAILALADGKSILNPEAEREGIVFRPLVETFEERFGRLSFKAISNKYLLNEKE